MTAIADADHDTRQELGVLTAVEHDLLSRHRLELSCSLCTYASLSGSRAHCGSANDAGALVGEPVELARRWRAARRGAFVWSRARPRSWRAREPKPVDHVADDRESRLSGMSGLFIMSRSSGELA